MSLSSGQESDLQDALDAAGIDATVAQVAAALDAANLVPADKDTAVKATYDPAVAPTITAVTGVPGLQVLSFTVGGKVLAVGRWRDVGLRNPDGSGSRYQIVPLAVVG